MSAARRFRRVPGWWRLALPLVAALVLPVFADQAYGQATPPGQLRPGRPYRGLFSEPSSDPNRHSTLDLAVSFLGGYDQNAAAGASSGGGNLGDPRFGKSSGLASAAASLMFDKVQNQNALYASGRAAFRYYPSLTQLNAADYGVSAGFSTRPSQRAGLSGSADFAYAPFFSLLAIPVFPGTGLPSGTGDFAFAERPSVVYGAVTDAAYDLTRRTHAVAGYTFRGFDFTRSGDAAGGIRQHNARAGVTRDLSRRSTLGGRYNYDRGAGSYTGLASTTRSHNGELTFDYRRLLRSRRQVSLGLSSGYGRIENEAPEAAPRVDRQISAAVRLAVDVGRTWTANGNYRRGLRRLPGIVDPVFSNDVEAGVEGLLGRRGDLTCTARYSKGETGASEWTGFDSASGTVQFRWALGRTTALRADYIYYWYEFPMDARIPAEFDRRVSRHGVRVGFDLWLPLSR